MRKRAPGSQVAFLADTVRGTALEKSSTLLEDTAGAGAVLQAIDELRARRHLPLHELDKWVAGELKRLLKPKAEAAKAAKLTELNRPHNVVDLPRVA